MNLMNKLNLKEYVFFCILAIHSAQRLIPRQKVGIHQDSFTDALLDDYERDGIIDERREVLMKTTAAQIYAGIVCSYSLVYVILLTKFQAGAETVGLFSNESGYNC